MQRLPKNITKHQKLQHSEKERDDYVKYTGALPASLLKALYSQTAAWIFTAKGSKIKF